MKKVNYPHASIADLDKLAIALNVEVCDLKAITAKSDSLYFLTQETTKADGSSRFTYDARPSLKKIHGKICDVFLKRVVYPDYLQGSIKKRDYLTNAHKHVASKVLISEDITNFFPSISKKIVHEMWIGVFGFSNIVAECLAELVTMDSFVVQGAKTSSYICNLVLWNREAKLVDSLKSRGLTYTRYVDDVTVSSKSLISLKGKSDIINSIYSLFRSIGAKPNRKKHKIMPRNAQQQVHGVNVNKNQPSMPKAMRKRIRAAVHRCEATFEQTPSSSAYLSLFNSVMGKVNTMGRMHKSEASQLKQRLSKVKPVPT